MTDAQPLPSREQLAELFFFSPDTGILVWRRTQRVGMAAGYRTKGGYIRVRVGRRLALAHRVIWAMTHNDPLSPEDQIDHINGNPSDNRLENLRVVPNVINARNQRRPRNSTSGHLGVSWHRDRKKWQAHIKVRGRLMYLGIYEDLHAAVAARRAASAMLGFHPNHGRDAT